MSLRVTAEQLELLRQRGAPLDPAAKRRAAGRAARQAGAAWEAAIIEWADLGGWLWWQPTPVPIRYPGAPADAKAPVMVPGRGTRGAPDFEMVHIRRRLHVRAEAKAGVAQVGAKQVVWLQALRSAGVTVCVWRDRDRDDVRDFLLGPRLTGRTFEQPPGLYTA